jgi:hypothetical protein
MLSERQVVQLFLGVALAILATAASGLTAVVTTADAVR